MHIKLATITEAEYNSQIFSTDFRQLGIGYAEYVRLLTDDVNYADGQLIGEIDKKSLSMLTKDATWKFCHQVASFCWQNKTKFCARPFSTFPLAYKGLKEPGHFFYRQVRHNLQLRLYRFALC